MSTSEDRGESLRMIRDSAAGIAPRTGDFKRIRALRFTEPGFDRAVWRDMCDMGWLGLLVSEDHGGSGLGVQEFCAVTEELGASLIPEPLIAAAMAARLLPVDHLSSVLSGERIILPAWQDKPHSIETTGGATVGNGRVSGKKLFIPMAAGADVLSHHSEPAPAVEATSLHILAVDDDALILVNTAAMLEDLGHEVVTAYSGREALAALAGMERVDLVVTDQAMPGMTGTELVAAIRRERPDLPVLLATGYAELPDGGMSDIPRLNKPFLQAHLDHAIAEVMRGRSKSSG